MRGCTNDVMMIYIKKNTNNLSKVFNIIHLKQIM